MLTLQRYRELFGMDPEDKTIWPTPTRPPCPPPPMYNEYESDDSEHGDPGCG